MEPAQRDQATAATGQLHEHLGTVGVRGSLLAWTLADQPAGDQPGRDGFHAAQFLPGQPPELIELVHAHVAEDAAAVGAERRRRRLQIPLVAGHQVDGAQHKSDAMVESLALGEPVDVHQVMLSLNEASNALQLTLQVRGKILEAYQDLMRSILA